MPLPALLTVRLAFVAFWLASAAFCIVAAVPFTRLQFYRHGLMPGQAFFTGAHPWLAVIVTGAAIVSLLLDKPLRQHRTALLAVAALLAAGALALLAAALLPAAGDESAGLGRVWACLVPIGLVGVVDLAASHPRLEWPAAGHEEERALFASVAVMAAGAGLGGSIIASAWDRTGFGVGALVAIWSGVQHLLLFSVAFAAVAMARGVAAMTCTPARTEFWIGTLLAAGGAAGALRAVVFRAVAFTGATADALALAAGGALALALAGIAARRALLAPPEASGGMARLLTPMALARRPGAASRAAAMGLLGTAAAIATTAVRQYDWNFLVQTLLVVIAWSVGLATLFVSAPRTRSRPSRTLGLLAVPILALAVHHGLEAGRTRFARWAGVDPLQLEAAFVRHAGIDPSSRVAREWLRPRAGRDDAGFTAFLHANSTISAARGIRPVPIDFFGAPRAAGAPSPHVFVFVLDSLRQDYVSPYNAAVTFTPAIAAFAREPGTITFRRAFTPYGATGLSEPSLWVGGRMPHQQYIEPFWPMNALQHLLERAQYRSLVSMDSILKTLLAPSARLEALDATVSNKDYDLCRTVDELAERLPRAAANGEPVFVYTQPQPIHVANINRGGGTPIDAADYGAFHAPYASRVRRQDACFGRFVERLKATGLWGRSVVVLTSDHGDSLGEGGRWGHAYTIYPEILRVPLLVHVPPALLADRVVDPEQTALLVDVTPTLYDLLGYTPTPRDPIVFGRSLLPRRDRPPVTPPDWHLVASSYGPVYGVLGGGGEWLYIRNAIDYTDAYYDLTAGPAGQPSPVTPALRALNDARIREGITRIHAAWGIGTF